MRATRTTLGRLFSASLAVATAVGAVAVMSPGPALAQDQAGPSTSARPDLVLDMPSDLGGFEPEVIIVRGREHFESPARDEAALAELDDLLDRLGAAPEDLTTGYALVNRQDLFAFVVAIRVVGIEPGSLLTAYLPIIEGDLTESRIEESQLGGRDILAIAAIGADGEFVDLAVYDEGDTVWILQGPREVVEVALAGLPDPLAGEPAT